MAQRVIVVGGGTMGLASAWRLAERGAKVTVLDPHEVPHDEGSHGGYTRVIRHAYHEGTGYVPLVREADAQWCTLERRPGDLLVRTGMLEFAPADHPEFLAALQACEVHDIDHTRLHAKQLRARHPFVVPDHWEGSFTPSGGYLRVRACLLAMREAAISYGTQFRTGTRVTEVGARSVTIEGGEVLRADRIVVAAGARTSVLVPGLALSPTRRVLLWLRPPANLCTGDRSLPVWGGFTQHGFFYGFPPGSEGVHGLKIACHTSDAIADLDTPVDPDQLDRTIHPADWKPVREFLRAHMPAAGEERIAHRVCVYGCTPSRDFLVDRHPQMSSIVVAAGFSGHGFKFAPAIGRLVADLCLDDDAPHHGFAWSTLGSAWTRD